MVRGYSPVGEGFYTLLRVKVFRIMAVSINGE